MMIEFVLAEYYVVIVNVFSVILCILCFCILFYIEGSCKCRVSGLLSSSYFELINDDDDVWPIPVP